MDAISLHMLLAVSRWHNTNEIRVQEQDQCNSYKAGAIENSQHFHK